MDAEMFEPATVVYSDGYEYFTENFDDVIEARAALIVLMRDPKFIHATVWHLGKLVYTYKFCSKCDKVAP